MMKVAALYVDPRGPYPKLLGPEMCWDEQRDARTYAGPWPVVAHPPCGPWSALRHLHTRPGDKELGLKAVAQVMKWGGVLEQPAGSKLWEVCGLPSPFGDGADGSFSVEVNQVSWGHVARKPTWLWFAGMSVSNVLKTLRHGGTPTHWCSGGRTKRPGMGATVPPGIKVCSAQQRRRTPIAFAEWLVQLAATARPGESR